MMVLLRTMYRWWLGAVLAGLAVVLLFPGVVLAQAQGGVGGTLADPLPVATQSPALPQYSGVEDSVKNFLCTPSDVPQGTDLIRCINRLYRFGISLGGISLVFAIVLAGYVYMFQGEGGKSQAKSIVTSSFVGILVLAGSYVLLRTINPQLTEFRPIQAPIFNATNLPSCADVGLGVDCITETGQVNTGVGSLKGEVGQCTIANMQACTTWNAAEAVAVCNAESGGNTAIGGQADGCLEVDGVRVSGRQLPISYGLFQINLKNSSSPEFDDLCKNVLTYNNSCPGGYGTVNGKQYCKGRSCSRPRGAAALDACIAALTDKTRNIKQACNLHKTSCWQPWITSAGKSGVNASRTGCKRS